MANTYVDAVTKRVDVNGTSFVYREAGEKNGIPIVLLHHLTAVLDDWDPRTIDSLAQKHRVIAFNNRGVGGSKGTTPDTIDDMATDAVAFIRALGLSKTDLLGFSLGGFIAQVIAQQHPDLVRRMILAGTSAAGGEGISNVASVLQNAVARATAEKKHPKQLLFFTQSQDGQKAAARNVIPAATVFVVRDDDRASVPDIAIPHCVDHISDVLLSSGYVGVAGMFIVDSSKFDK